MIAPPAPYTVAHRERKGEERGQGGAIAQVQAKVLRKESEVKVLVTQSCLTLCSLTDCSPPGSSVHGISQARVLEWVTIPFSRGSSRPRNWTQVSWIAGGFFTI